MKMKNGLTKQNGKQNENVNKTYPHKVPKMRFIMKNAPISTRETK